MIHIYRHTHRISGKCYVGQTRQTMLARWYGHVAHAKKDPLKRHHFQLAILKHGPEAFDHDLLEVVGSQAEADEAERWWIEHFGSNDRRIGYNLDAGGRGGGAKSSSTKEKMSASGKAARARRGREAISDDGRKRAITMGPERLAAAAAKGLATRTGGLTAADLANRRAAQKEARKAAAPLRVRTAPPPKANPGKSPEARRARGLQSWASVSSEAKTRIAETKRDQMLSMTPEERAHRAAAGAAACWVPGSKRVVKIERFVVRGVPMSRREIAAAAGISIATVKARVRRGWAADDLILPPGDKT